MLKPDGYPMHRPRWAMSWPNPRQAFLGPRANSIEVGPSRSPRTCWLNGFSARQENFATTRTRRGEICRAADAHR
jgi:hypothetical protein